MTTDQRASLLPDLARRHAAERPEAPAVIDGASVWTWWDLDRRADAIGAAVRGLGVGAGERVGLAVGGTALGVAALHGISRAGVTAVLVHPRLTDSEVATLVEAAGCGAIVVDPAIDIVAPPGVATLRLDAIDIDPVAPVTTAVSSELILPTSGTTARPKLVRLPLDRLAASVAAWTAFLPPATGWLLSLGLGHVAGIGIVTRAAATGVPIVIPSSPEPVALLAAVAAARTSGVFVSHLSLVATQLAAILDATADAPPPDGVTAVILGGGPIPDRLLRRAVAAGWPVIPSYGLTETASGVVALSSGEVAAHAGSAGRPLPGVQIRTVDGRIEVRGPMVFAGYLGDDAATATALSPDGWLRTGDLGSIDADGLVTVIGRADATIITGGENVAPAEIEAVVAEHPDVREVAVIGVPDPTWGAVPVAVIVLRDGTNPGDDDLRAFARARLARFKVPARFVRVTGLPRNSLGKVVRADLQRLASTPPPAPEPTRHTVTTDDGQTLVVFDLDDAAAPDRPTVVVLHATLSTSEQLLRLGRRLAEHARVILVDRRGSGASAMVDPGPVPVPHHVEDVIAVLDALDLRRVTLVGHSYGGVVALEAAARHPDRIDGVFAWEPPYVAVAPAPVQAAMARVGDQVALAFAQGGAEAAAHRFLDTVAGPGAWDSLHPRQRAWIGREGTGALADAAMLGLDPDGLERIACAVLIATGAASEPFYLPIADALADRLGERATRVHVPDLRHPAPITDPAIVAELALRLLDAAHPQETTP